MSASMNIKIDFTESDLQDLLSGQTFDWSYISDTNERVNVHLYNSDLEGDL